MLRRISQIIDPSKLDYIVVNHMELDHSGSLAELKKQTDAKILITKGASISLMATSGIRAVRPGTWRL